LSDNATAPSGGSSSSSSKGLKYMPGSPGKLHAGATPAAVGAARAATAAPT
jgi:hypothetical protein